MYIVVRDKMAESTGARSGSSGANVLTLAATFQVGPLKPRLEAWIRLIGAPHRIEIAPTGPPHRYIIDPLNGLIRHTDGIHVMLFRLDDWNNFSGAAESGDEIHPASRELVERNLRLTIESLHAVADTCFGALILVLCPLSADHRRRRAIQRYFATVEARLREAIDDYPQYTVVNAEEPGPQAEWEVAEPGEPVPAPVAQGLDSVSRRIAQACYAMESRPWRALVVSPDGIPPGRSAELRAFVSSQWKTGRCVALASNGTFWALDETYAVADCSPGPAWSKLRQMAKSLLVPEHDMAFLGGRDECEEVQRRLPGVLALPALDSCDGFPAILQELWCLQPIGEMWRAEFDAVKPALPRLSQRLLMALAAHPDWPAGAFLKSHTGAAGNLA